MGEGFGVPTDQLKGPVAQGLGQMATTVRQAPDDLYGSLMSMNDYAFGDNDLSSSARVAYRNCVAGVGQALTRVSVDLSAAASDAKTIAGVVSSTDLWHAQDFSTIPLQPGAGSIPGAWVLPEGWAGGTAGTKSPGLGQTAGGNH